MATILIVDDMVDSRQLLEHLRLVTDKLSERTGDLKTAGRIHTVLVVDDADEICDLAKRLLERQGYSVLVATNGDDAVRLFERHGSIDLLLTDVVMPGVSGPELRQQLVTRQPTLKVVFMSGYSDQAIANYGLNPGAAVLAKPFTSAALGQKIQETLDE